MKKSECVWMWIWEMMTNQKMSRSWTRLHSVWDCSSSRIHCERRLRSRWWFPDWKELGWWTIESWQTVWTNIRWTDGADFRFDVPNSAQLRSHSFRTSSDRLHFARNRAEAPFHEFRASDCQCPGRTGPRHERIFDEFRIERKKAKKMCAYVVHHLDLFFDCCLQIALLVFFL